MGIKEILFTGRKRELPFVFDKTLKGAFRIAHVLSFGILFGGIFFGVADASAYGPLVALSGLLILLREVYKEGAWLCQTRGVLTILKTILLFLLSVLEAVTFSTLVLIAVMGVLASHLPRILRKKEILRFCRAKHSAE